MTIQADDRLIEAVAEELSSLGHRIEHLGMKLASDRDILVRHVELLQEFDLMAQTHTELASILRLLTATGAGRAMADVRLEALAARLSQRSLDSCMI